MGRPRLIIVCRHAQSEGNQNKKVHQTTPDHRVKLTAEGWTQAYDAGRRLRDLLKPDDTLGIYTSPYRRTRETTEGILKSLTSCDGDDPSPFPQSSIKVWEEPRLREQDFGNFQPNSEAMQKMWHERAEYGHFFYRIPNGESAADAYDRISGFNETLHRSFSEPDFPNVLVLVTHGLMSRVFLMRWYHWSVEYFEDLRNMNHCEFLVMNRSNDTGKYELQNKLRTWSQLKRERELKEKEKEKEPSTAIQFVESSDAQSRHAGPRQRNWSNYANGKPFPRRRSTKNTYQSGPRRKSTKSSTHLEQQLKELADTLNTAVSSVQQQANGATVSPLTRMNPDDKPSAMSMASSRITTEPDTVDQLEANNERARSPEVRKNRTSGTFADDEEAFPGPALCIHQSRIEDERKKRRTAPRGNEHTKKRQDTTTTIVSGDNNGNKLTVPTRSSKSSRSASTSQRKSPADTTAYEKGRDFGGSASGAPTPNTSPPPGISEDKGTAILAGDIDPLHTPIDLSDLSEREKAEIRARKASIVRPVSNISDEPDPRDSSPGDSPKRGSDEEKKVDEDIPDDDGDTAYEDVDDQADDTDAENEAIEKNRTGSVDDMKLHELELAKKGDQSIRGSIF